MFARSLVCRAVSPYMIFLKRHAGAVSKKLGKGVPIKERAAALKQKYDSLGSAELADIKKIASKTNVTRREPKIKAKETVRTVEVTGMSPFALFLKRNGAAIHKEHTGKPLKVRARAVAAAYKAMPPKDKKQLLKDASKVSFTRQYRK